MISRECINAVIDKLSVNPDIALLVLVTISTDSQGLPIMMIDGRINMNLPPRFIQLLDVMCTTLKQALVANFDSVFAKANGAETITFRKPATNPRD